MVRPITVILTIPVVVLLTQPLWAPQWGEGIVREVAGLGLIGSIAAITVFFGLIALYCRGLQLLLHAVPLEHRARSPRSVWLMFAIPFNFIEDFFIVGDLGESLGRWGILSATRLRVWQALGYGWAALQLVSLLPGTIGFVGGGLTVVGWIAHWVLTASIRRGLPAR